MSLFTDSCPLLLSIYLQGRSSTSCHCCANAILTVFVWICQANGPIRPVKRTSLNSSSNHQLDVDKMDRASSFKKDGNTDVPKTCILLFSQHEKPNNNEKQQQNDWLQCGKEHWIHTFSILRQWNSEPNDHFVWFGPILTESCNVCGFGCNLIGKRSRLASKCVRRHWLSCCSSMPTLGTTHKSKYGGFQFQNDPVCQDWANHETSVCISKRVFANQWMTSQCLVQSL